MLSKNESGFTLLELLLVAAVISLLASVLLTVVDPKERIVQARESQVKNDLGVLSRSLEAHYSENGSFYTVTLDDLSPDLKTVPSPPPGWSPEGDGKYGYAKVGSPTPQSAIIVYSRLQSKQELKKARDSGLTCAQDLTNLYWRYLSETRKTGYYCGSSPGLP